MRRCLTCLHYKYSRVYEMNMCKVKTGTLTGIDQTLDDGEHCQLYKYKEAKNV
jgi:hypothetical protein